MVKKVIRSKALYGRINLEINLKPLHLDEAAQFFPKMSSDEKIKYMMLFGTIPKYLEEINPRISLDRNIIALSFSKDCLFINEVDRIFFSQFKEARNYKLIIEKLILGPLTQEEIGKKINMGSGGGVKNYIDNLVMANFIAPINNFAQATNKGKKYKVVDEYLIFYFKFIAKYVEEIQQGRGAVVYKNIIKPKWSSWLGLAFERLCLQHSHELSEKMDIAESVISSGSYSDKSVQCDLLYRHYDERITLVEIKYNSKEMGVEVIPEIESKVQKLKQRMPAAIETALLCAGPISKKLVKSEYFDINYQLKL
jgi:hypothetical protein